MDTTVESLVWVTISPPVSLSRRSTSTSWRSVTPPYTAPAPPPLLVTRWVTVRSMRFSGVASSNAVTRMTKSTFQLLLSKVTVRAPALNRAACSGWSAASTIWLSGIASVTVTVSPAAGARVRWMP